MITTPHRIIFAGLILLFGLSGCAVQSTLPADNFSLLKDELFPNATTDIPETGEEVFRLSESAKAFVNDAGQYGSDEKKHIAALIEAMLYTEKGIRYLTSANSVAADTFANREANCLSLTILAYSMAEYAGFHPTLYEVNIPEFWTRRDGVSLLNGHVNMRISTDDNLNKASFTKNYLDVDFDPQMLRRHFDRVEISRDKVLAMFYNNKGADALIAGDADIAYAYFRQAAVTHAPFASTWVNLGVLYRQQGALEAAEATYQHALSLDEDNFTAWENLAVLYEAKGLSDKASAIKRSLHDKRESNVFYHYILGEEAFENGDVEAALRHYVKAQRLERNRHEILFGLGKAYYELGETDKAVTYIKMAARLAPGRHDEQRYLSKLPSLQSAL